MFEDNSFLLPGTFTDLVRIGPQGDGGYVLPAFIIPLVQQIVSFGVCDDWRFEEALMKISSNRVKITAYDGSAGAQYYIDRIKDRPLKLSRYLSSLYGYIKFKRFFDGKLATFIPKFVGYRFSQRKWISINDVAVDFQLSTLLKVDVEGSEYALLRYDLSNVGCLIIEFHEIFKYQESFFRLVEKLQRSFIIAHIHPNNAKPFIENFPDILEMTFVNRKLCDISHVKKVDSFVSPVDELDYPCRPDKPVQFFRIFKSED